MENQPLFHPAGVQLEKESQESSWMGQLQWQLLQE